MKMTKAQLEAENERLQELANAGTRIENCIFHGSATDAQCAAVEQLAIAIQKAAEALKGSPAIVLNQEHLAHGTKNQDQ